MPPLPLRCLLCTALLLTMGFEWPGRLNRLRYELKHGDEAARRVAALQLSNYPAKDVSDALLIALEDPEQDVRLAAAVSAGRTGLKAAVPLLTDWLVERDPVVRSAAARALGHIGLARSTTPLVRLLGDERAEVRRAAVGALGRVGDRAAVEPLLGRLDEPDVSVRTDVIDTLALLGDSRAVVPLLAQATTGAIEVQLATLGALSVLGDGRALPSLLQALGSEHAAMRFAAIDAIGKLRLEGAIDALIQRLSLPDTRQAKSLISALGNIGTPRSLRRVIGELPNNGRHDAAALALLNAAARENEPQPGRVASESAAPTGGGGGSEAPAHGPDASAGVATGLVVQLLIDALSGADETDHADAIARALARVAGVARIDAATAPLLTALGRAGDLREGLLAALARTRTPEALEPLLQQLARPKDVPAEASLAALSTYFEHVPIDGRAADPLLAALPQVLGADRVVLVGLLGRSGAAHAIEVLAPMASGDDEPVQHAALRALGQIGGGRAAKVLLTQLDADSGSTRFITAQALGTCGGQGTAKALLQRLLDDAPLDRHAALVALGPILGRLKRGKGLHPTLASVADGVFSRLADEGDEELTARLIDALSLWRPDKGLEQIATYLRSRSLGLRTRAALAIGNFPSNEALGLARFLLTRTATPVAASAIAALGEIGSHRDIPALQKVVRRRHWPLQGAVAFAIARMAQRGVLRSRAAQRALCALGESREPYLRANVAAAMATLEAGACEDDGPNPVEWLGADHAPAVRFAAARWLRAGANARRIEPERAAAALRQCQQRDLDPEVAAVCGARPEPQVATEPLDLYAYGADGSTLLRNRLIAVRFVDGSVLLAYTDQNGHLTAPAVPAGRIVLEDPSQLPLEAH